MQNSVVRRSSFVAAAMAALCAWATGCGDNQQALGLGPDHPGSPDNPVGDGPGGDGGGNGPGESSGPGPGSGSNGGGPIEVTPPPSCDIAWHDVQLGTELDDQVWGLATDASDNVYIAGFEHGITGVTNIEPDGNSRGVVIKLDPSGEVAWRRALDTAGSDTVEGLAVDPASGTLYAVGRTSGAFDGFTSGGQFDAFLAALDDQGRIATMLQVGDERPQHPTRVSLGAGHEVNVAGYDDTFVVGHAIEANEDGFIGSFERGASAPDALAEDVAAERDGSGSMYIASWVASGRPAGPGLPPPTGIYVKKLNRNGSEAWSTKITNVSADAANAVALSPSNELFVAGATFRQLGQRSFGQQDAFVLKVNKTTGAVIWAAQAGSADSDFPTALAFDGDNNVYVAGYTFRPKDPDHPEGDGAFEPFVMKFDSRGVLLSTWRGGTDQLEFVTSMVVDRCGHVYIGGYTKGTMVEGVDNAGGWDMFVIRPTLPAP
jgi:hypothetical protein